MNTEQQNELLFLVFVLVVTLSIQLPILNAWPFITDENLYALIIAEQMDGKMLVPTLFGYEALWKPPLFFWVYADVVSVLHPLLDLPIEGYFRLPTVFFGILSAWALYYLLKALQVQEKLRYITLILYVLMPLVIYTNNSVLMDTMAHFFILLSLLFYVKKDWPSHRFLAAGILVMLAFFTKFLLAAMAPLLAVGYFFLEDRKTLRHPLFLLSLLAIPLSLGLHYVLVNDPENFTMLYATDMIGNFTRHGSDGSTVLAKLVHSAQGLFFVAGVWLFLSFFGLLKYWKTNRFLAFWYLLIAIPIFTAGFRPWYFLPLAPAIAYFSAMALTGVKEGIRIDRFAVFGALLFLLSSTILAQLFFWTLLDSAAEHKRMGEMMVGKGNMLLFGNYWIGTIAYKVLNERLETGTYNDFGWMVVAPQSFTESPRDYIEDYYRENPDINDENINRIYWKYEEEIFRKRTNVTNFDYAVIAGEYELLDDAGTVMYNSSAVQVIQLNN